MTRPELARALAKKTKMTQRQAENVIIAFASTIKDALERGDKIVYSNFGTFYTVHYPSKTILHPRYGAAKKMIMLPTNVAKWMPADKIKEMVDKGLTLENPTAHGKKKIIPEPQPKPLQPTAYSQLPTHEGTPIPIKIMSKKVALEPKPEQALAEEESKKSTTPKEQNNIYEELMENSGKAAGVHNEAQVSPHAPSILNVHEEAKKSFWNRLIRNKETEKSENDHQDEKPSPAKPESNVSLVGEGIFDKNISHALPNQATKSPQAPEVKTGDKPEAKIETTKKNDDQNSTPVPEEKPIIPFDFGHNDITYIDLSKTVAPKEVLGQIPEKIAKRFKAVPVEEKDGQLVIAMADPEDIEAREIIKRYTKKKISLRLASEADINHVLDQYQGLESEVLEAIEEVDPADKESKNNNTKALIESALDDAPAARIVSSLLKRAIRDKASDIHIEPEEKDVQVRFRLDGILRKKVTLPKDILLAVVSRIKILANLKIDEQRLPQDGRFSISIDSRKVDFRISTMPTSHGEKVVMRVLDKSAGILTVEQLGLSGSGLEALKSNLGKTHGMILVTGPTGSGKTTTLYALIDKMYNEGVNIITLEDPIEYQMPGINQSQVNHEIDYTFASGLRSIVRQDPDIIMIGEIRDSETAEMAVQAALTGHVVLSTLHTNNAAGAAPRLIDMKVEPFLLTSSVNVIFGQRLARKICDECKEEIKVSEEELATVKKIVEGMPEKERKEFTKPKYSFIKGKGCKSCDDSGYKGRIGIFEVMSVNESIRELVLKRASSTAIEEAAVAQGMVTMIQDGIIKAIQGQTTLEEVWRVTKD